MPIYLDLTGSIIFLNIYYLKNVLYEISVLSSHRDEKNIADIIIPVSAVTEYAGQNWRWKSFVSGWNYFYLQQETAATGRTEEFWFESVP
mgnify:CR=1 FL=1